MKKEQVIAGALVGLGGLTMGLTPNVQAEELADQVVEVSTQTVEGKQLTNIETVPGVTVSNGTAMVTQTPTTEVVDKAHEIMVEADQAVTDQTAVIAEATESEAQAKDELDKATTELTTAEGNKAEATPEAIEQAGKAIETVKADMAKADQALTEGRAKTNEAQDQVNAQADVVTQDQAAIDGQTSKVEAAQAGVASAQANLDGTGAAQVIAERDNAQKDLTTATTAEKEAQSTLDTAKVADAKRAEELALLATQKINDEANRQAAAQALADATKEANQKASDKASADQEVEDIKAQIAAVEGYDIPKLTPEFAAAYRKFAQNPNRIVGTAAKDEFWDAVSALYDALGDYTKSITTPTDETIVEPGNLTREQVTALSQYITYIHNGIRRQIWGENVYQYVVTEDSITAVMKIAESYEKENKIDVDNHSHDAINSGNISGVYSTIAENLIFGLSKNETTMTKLYSNIYETSIGLLGIDYNDNYAHVTTLWGHGGGAELQNGSRQTLTYNISTTPSGFTREHQIRGGDFNTTDIIASPYDNDATALQARLVEAQAKQQTATSLNDVAQARLVDARSADVKAQSALDNTSSRLVTLEAQGKQVPSAQAQLTQATAQREAAETRLTAAQSAVDNLNADIQTKRDLLEKAKADLATEEAVLETLKANKSASEAILAEKEAKLAELKEKETHLSADLAALSTALTAAESKLTKLQNADVLLAQAQAKFAEASTKHLEAKDRLDKEVAKLSDLLLNQKDAKAQYDVVKGVYLSAQRTAIVKNGGAPVPVYDAQGQVVSYKDDRKPAPTPASQPTYSRVERARQLPKTGDSHSLLAFLGVLLFLVGLVPRKRKN